MRTNTDREPAANKEVEQGVLGAMLLKNDVIEVVADALGYPDFYYSQHQIIFKAIIAVFRTGQQVDAMTVANHLKDGGLLGNAGGLTYLNDLMETTPGSRNVDAYARIIREDALLRRVAVYGQRVLDMSYDRSQTLEDVMDRAERELRSLQSEQGAPCGDDLTSIIGDQYEDYERWMTSLPPVVPTGLQSLDDMLIGNGLSRSDLIVLAARPSLGKTALALSIARNVAIAEQAVVFFSIEMSKPAITNRLIAMHGRFNAKSIIRRKVAKGDFHRLQQVVGSLMGLPLQVRDRSDMTVARMRERVRQEQAKRPVGLVVIDHLHAMAGGSEDSNECQRIAVIVKEAKALAKDMNVPVLLLCQLNRAVESRSNKRPVLSDLRATGAIEEVADVVLFLYSDAHYGKDGGKLYREEDTYTEVICAKQRNGTTGMIRLQFSPLCVRFDEPEGAAADG